MSTPRFTSEHRVGVLMGGLSPERDISMKSGKAVAKSLRSRGYTVIEIVVNRDIATVLEQTKIDEHDEFVLSQICFSTNL